MDRIPSNRAVSPDEDTPARQQMALRNGTLRRLYQRIMREHSADRDLPLLFAYERSLSLGHYNHLLPFQYLLRLRRIEIVRLCCDLESHPWWTTNNHTVTSLELLIIRWIALERATTDDNADPLDPQTVQQYLREQARIATLFGIQPTQSPRPLCRGSVYARNTQFIRERTAIMASLRCAGTNPCQQLVRRARSGRSILNASLLHPIFTRRQRYTSLIRNSHLVKIYAFVSFLFLKQYSFPVVPLGFFEHSPFIQACIQQCLAIESRLGQYNPRGGFVPTFLELLNERCMTVLQSIIIGITAPTQRQRALLASLGYHSLSNMYVDLCVALFESEQHQPYTPRLSGMSTSLYYWGDPRFYQLIEEPLTITIAYQQLMQAGPLSGCDEHTPPMQALIEACISAENFLFPGSIIPNANLATVLHHRHRFLYCEHDQADYDDSHGHGEETQAVCTACEEMLTSFRSYLSS